MHLHVFSTWVLANLLHPFIMLLYIGYPIHPSFVELLGNYSSILYYSVIFSLPSLFISFLWVYLISRLQVPAIGIYIIWLVSAPLLIILNMLLILILFPGAIGLLGVNYFIPAMIAVVIIILIRHDQFYSLTIQIKETKHENNLV